MRFPKSRSGWTVAVGLVLIAISAIGLSIQYALGVSPFHTVAIDEEQSVAAGGVTRIDVFSNIGDVRVVTGGDAIRAKMTGKAERSRRDEFRLTVTERDGRVIIEAAQDRKRRLVSVDPGHYELLVEVPDRLYDRVEIATMAADVTVADVKAAQLSIRTEHGDIETAGLAGGITARTVTGDIRLGVSSISEDIHAETVMGDILVIPDETPPALALDLKTFMGEEKVMLPGTALDARGEGTPTVKLTAEIGDLAVLAADAPAPVNGDGPDGD